MELELPVRTEGWLSLLAIGVLGGVVQISAFAYALPRLSASGYSVIVSMELVTCVVLGVWVLGEPMSGVQAAGVGLVIVSIIADRIMRARAAARGS